MKRPKISALESHLGYWLRFVSNQVSHAFGVKLESRGVTVAEWVVMRELLEQDAMAPSQLAAQLGMTRGAISKLVDRLIEKSLVGKTAGDRDRRYQAVSLTVQGRALVPALAALADLNDEEFFGRLTRSDRDLLMMLMKQLVRSHGLKEIPID